MASRRETAFNHAAIPELGGGVQLDANSVQLEFINDSLGTVADHSTPNPIPPSNPILLCQRCLLVDFRKLFQPVSSTVTIENCYLDRPFSRSSISHDQGFVVCEDEGIDKAAGGAWDYQKCLQERSCAFCCLLVEIMRYLYRLGGKQVNITVQRGTLTADMQLTKVQFASTLSAYRDSIGKEIEAIFETVWHEIIFRSDTVEPCHIRPLSTSYGGIHEQGFARRFPKVLDLDLIRLWLSICDTKHKAKCEETRIEQPLVGIRLINVEEGCIESIPDGSVPQYVALSYVWGSFPQPQLLKSNEHELYRPGVLSNGCPLPGSGLQLPRTVKDAITLALKLGLRYLWVDTLCIVQDSKTSRQQQIDQMHAIYHWAHIAIIAAGGNNSDAGLVGLSRARRGTDPPFYADVGSFQVAATKKSAFSDLLVSRWRSRGWTLQEEFFSRRKLIFMEDIVAFQCSEAHWREDVAWESTNNAGFLTRGSPERGVNSHFSRPDFEALLEDYLSRSLSNPSDILNGFTGLMHFFKPRFGEFLFGLSKTEFCNSICWDYGNDFPTSRRLGFPSWSWAGWSWETYKKAVDFYRLKLWPSEGSHHLIRFYELEGLDSIAFEPGDHGLVKHPHFISDFQQITSFQLSLASDPSVNGMPKYLIAFFTSWATLKVEKDPTGGTGYLVKTRDGQQQVTTLAVPPNWLSSQSPLHDFIVIGYHPDSNQFTLMLIRRVGKVSERVQLAKPVDTGMWWSLEPQRKLIVLG